jgi:hypothetical protein
MYGTFEDYVSDPNMLKHSESVVLQEEGRTNLSYLRMTLVDPHPPSLPRKKISGEEPTDTAPNDFDSTPHCVRPFRLFETQMFIAATSLDRVWNASSIVVPSFRPGQPCRLVTYDAIEWSFVAESSD